MYEFYRALALVAFVIGCLIALIRVESSLLVFAWGAVVRYIGETYG